MDNFIFLIIIIFHAIYLLLLIIINILNELITSINYGVRICLVFFIGFIGWLICVIGLRLVGLVGMD